VAEDPASAAEALPVLAGSTEATAATGRDTGDKDPVSDATTRHGRTDLLDRPYGLVTEDPAVADGRHVALQDVQVSAADRHCVDAHHRVGGFDHSGLGHLVTRADRDRCTRLLSSKLLVRDGVHTLVRRS
jgi:hypothetical protein